MDSGIVRKMDALGRIVIPSETRRLFNMREGDELTTSVEGAERKGGEAGSYLHILRLYRTGQKLSRKRHLRQLHRRAVRPPLSPASIRFRGPALGDQVFEEKQANRRRSMKAMKTGDLGRTLFVAEAPGWCVTPPDW